MNNKFGMENFHSNSGNWKIYTYDSDVPEVKGQLTIDSTRYIVKDNETAEILLVVPAGNVSYALNLEKVSVPKNQSISQKLNNR